MIDIGDIIKLKAEITTEEITDRMETFPNLPRLIGNAYVVESIEQETFTSEAKVIISDGKFPTNMFECVEKGRYVGVLLTNNEHALLNVLSKRFSHLKKDSQGFFVYTTVKNGVKLPCTYYHFGDFEGITFYNIEPQKYYNIEKLKRSPTKLPF